MIPTYKIEVIEAIAEAEGEDPAQLKPPLGTAVDLEALENYLRATDTDCWATFQYRGYFVTVDSDCEIELSRMTAH